jgi:hypothetical protein
MIKNIISRLTMVKVDNGTFDHYKQINMYYWQDCYFNVYLASNRFSKRIKINTL